MKPVLAIAALAFALAQPKGALAYEAATCRAIEDTVAKAAERLQKWIDGDRPSRMALVSVSMKAGLALAYARDETGWPEAVTETLLSLREGPKPDAMGNLLTGVNGMQMIFDKASALLAAAGPACPDNSFAVIPAWPK
jgi:hypothetical protein